MNPAREFDQLEEIVLTVPARVHYARVARLAVTGLASRAGFSYDEIEDLRIAIGEVCSLMLGPDDGADPSSAPDDGRGTEAGAGRLTLRCEVGAGDLVVEASRTPIGAVLDVSDLSQQILAAVVDEAHIDPGEGRVRVAKRHRG